MTYFTNICIALTATIMFLFLYSCSQDNGIRHEVQVYIDLTAVTDCNVLVPTVQENVLNILQDEQSKGVTRNGMRLTLIPIGGQSFPPVFTAEVPIDTDLFRDTKARAQVISNFIDDKVPRLIDATCRSDLDTSFTFLYKILHENLGDLMQSKADQKTTFIYSDAINHDPAGFSMYRLRKTPNSLLDDFPKWDDLVNALYGQGPTLDGVNIILQHSPTRRDQLLFDAAQQFMERHFTVLGATFKRDPVIIDFDSASDVSFSGHY